MGGGGDKNEEQLGAGKKNSAGNRRLPHIGGGLGSKIPAGFFKFCKFEYQFLKFGWLLSKFMRKFSGNRLVTVLAPLSEIPLVLVM